MNISVASQLLIGLVANVLIVTTAFAAPTVVGAPEYLRANVVTLTVVTLFLAAFVWIPFVIGSGAAQWLPKPHVGFGHAVIVLGTDVQGARWAVRRYLSGPRIAEVRCDDEALRIRWADGGLSNIPWTGRPTVDSRRVFVSHKRANSVIIRTRGDSIEYVPVEDGFPLAGSAYRAYVDAILAVAPKA